MQKAPQIKWHAEKLCELLEPYASKYTVLADVVVVLKGNIVDSMPFRKIKAKPPVAEDNVTIGETPVFRK